MDEQKITRYALGEMSTAEKTQFEQDLLNSPLLQKELEGIRLIVSALKSAHSDNPSLSPEQRERLRADCLKNIRSSAPVEYRNTQSSSSWLSDSLRFGLPLAAAAVVCVAFLVWQNPDPSLALPKTDTSLIASFSQNGSSSGSGSGSSSGSSSGTGASIPLSTGISSYSSSLAQESFASPNSSAFQRNKSIGSARSSLSEHSAYFVPVQEYEREGYNAIEENEFKNVTTSPLSTFSIDVDTASYANVRRFLNEGILPPPGSVRTEEMLNYFRYEYPLPSKEEPFSVSIEASQSPWSTNTVLVKIGLRGQEIQQESRPPSNLVFLLDTSGSMASTDKLPLLKRALKEMLSSLGENDTVSIVTYAGSSGVVLPPTPGAQRSTIASALDHLSSGGSTAGSEGINLAYELATGNSFLKKGNNRVILCTDGDFNVGQTSQASLESLIEEKRKSGVYLTVLGFGTGNLQDSTMELLANKGNGNYAYIDSMAEARKVLGSELGSTLFTIAKDVKIQVEFNPAEVEAYRLVGYENRLLEAEDFNNDKKDAGEIGAGHTVTALYELVKKGDRVPGSPSTDPLKYQSSKSLTSGELMTVKIRYKLPSEDRSRLLERTLTGAQISSNPSAEFDFAAAVASFSMKLTNSVYAENLDWSDIKKLAQSSLGNDEGSLRAEFLTLVEKARQIASSTQNDYDTPVDNPARPVGGR